MGFLGLLAGYHRNHCWGFFILRRNQMEKLPPKTKICSKCGEEKEFEQFAKSDHCKFGVGNACKECYRKSKRQWQRENKEKCKQYRERWNENIENVISHRKTVAQWKKNNPEHVKAFKREWYRKNTQKCKEGQQRSLRKRTPEKVQEQKERLAIKSHEHYVA